MVTIPVSSNKQDAAITSLCNMQVSSWIVSFFLKMLFNILKYHRSFPNMDIRKLLVLVISDFILNLVFLYPATCMAQIWVEIGRVFGSVSLTDTAAQNFSLDAVKQNQ